MIKFTKEEKNLCKQLAKKHRKEIEYGDWYYTTEYPEEKYRARIYKYRWTGMADRTINKRTDIIPLWTISDCLEFLREKGWFVRDLIEYEGEFGTTFLYQRMSEEKFINGDGKTLLEAFLKVVIEVLKNEKI